VGGAARVGNYKAVFNLRGDDGEKTGGLAIDSNLGWKGPEEYVATVPQVAASPFGRAAIFLGGRESTVPISYCSYNEFCQKPSTRPRASSRSISRSWHHPILRGKYGE